MCGTVRVQWYTEKSRVLPSCMSAVNDIHAMKEFSF